MDGKTCGLFDSRSTGDQVRDLFSGRVKCSTGQNNMLNGVKFFGFKNYFRQLGRGLNPYGLIISIRQFYSAKSASLAGMPIGAVLDDCAGKAIFPMKQSNFR